MIKISKLLIFSQNLVNKFYLNRSRRYKILVTEDRSREISRKFKDRSNIYSIFSRFRNSIVWFLLPCNFILNNPQYRIHGKKNSKRSLRGILSFFFCFLLFEILSSVSKRENLLVPVTHALCNSDFDIQSRGPSWDPHARHAEFGRPRLRIRFLQTCADSHRSGA